MTADRRSLIRKTLASFAAAAFFTLPLSASVAETISEQDAHAIGVQAYLYFYSPITMDVTRKLVTEISDAGGLHHLATAQ